MRNSLIRSLISEAVGDPEVLSVPDETAPQEAPNASLMTPDAPPAPEQAQQAAAPGNPQEIGLNFIQKIPSTINKKVINKELIVAVLSEMKSSITNYQKKFESEDMDIRDADIYLTNFINSSIYQLTKLNDFIAGDENHVNYEQEPQ